MPSIKKRVYGIIRQLSSGQIEVAENGLLIDNADRPSVVDEEKSSDHQTDQDQTHTGCFIRQYLHGKLLLRESPEIYHDKAGVDLPVLQVAAIDRRVVSAYTGPDGGITQV